MGLFDDLRKLSEQARRFQPHIKGEEATKHALVLPVLQVLGYNIHDPTEIKPEYVADFATRGKEKVDYLIMAKGEPAIFVECKAVDAAVEAHDGQLKKYFNSTPSVKLAIITNGIHWRFFTDLRLQHIMDDNPFLEINILNVTERTAGLLEPFTRFRFNSGGIRQLAEEAISLEKITGLINGILSKPSDSFVRYIVKELDLVGGMVNAGVIARFEPIVKKSIETALLEMVTKPIREMQEPVPDVSPQLAPGSTSVPNTTPAPLSMSAENPNIVTTTEELAIFEAVKRICSESSSKIPVVYKDGTNYFTINLGPERSWFLRLYTGSRRKSFVVRLAPSKVESIVKGFTPEPIASQPTWARIEFGANSDVERLRPLILRAYEEAAQKQSGVQADSSE